MVSGVFGGGDSGSAVPPQLLSQIGALYTHVPPASWPSYITQPVQQQRTRGDATRVPPAPWGRGYMEGREVSLVVALQGRGSRGCVYGGGGDGGGGGGEGGFSLPLAPPRSDLKASNYRKDCRTWSSPVGKKAFCPGKVGTCAPGVRGREGP